MSNEKEIKHYIEVFYNYNPDRGTQEDFTYSHIVTNRDPLLYMERFHGAKGFRFFDVDVSDNSLNKEKRTNISPMYYYGRYMAEQEIEQVHNVMPFTINITKMIYCYCGCLVTDLNEGDMTLETYANLVNNEEPNFESKQLLKMSVACPKKCAKMVI